jgi:hypothetical protein
MSEFEKVFHASCESRFFIPRSALGIDGFGSLPQAKRSSSQAEGLTVLKPCRMALLKARRADLLSFRCHSAFRI